MWYVMQVCTGSEQNIMSQCQIRIPKTILDKCFVPQYEEKSVFKVNGT